MNVYGLKLNYIQLNDNYKGTMLIMSYMNIDFKKFHYLSF